MLSNSKFIKLKNQIVNVNTIIKVEEPRSTASGIDWYIRTLIDTTVCPENYIQSFYGSEQEAKEAYSKITEELCSK